ncbi:MAG: hypothetical protein AB8B80_04050 [Marinicellaceae bacterium]
MKKLFVILMLMACFKQLQSQVLIVGDSWAQQQYDDGVHVAVFSNNGFADINVVGDSTARSGSEASEWATPVELQKIADALSVNPEIDTVQLTVGGNDFLNNWSANMSVQQELNLQQQILADLTTIVDFILAQKSDIEIILSFYDYPNFVDTVSGLSGFDCNLLLTQQLGSPTTSMLNTAAVEFESIYAQIATNNPRVFHVSHFGLMQNFYDNVPLPGNISSPSPVIAMREIFPDPVVYDCFHLSPTSYEVLVSNLFDGYYQERFDTVFKSGFDLTIN